MLRFRLRTLLVVFSVIAVVCALLGERIHRGRRERNAIQSLRPIGVRCSGIPYVSKNIEALLNATFVRDFSISIEYIPESDDARMSCGDLLDLPENQETFRELIPSLPEVRYVSLRGRFPSEWVELVSGLDDVQSIEVEGVPLCEDDLEHIFRMSALETITLRSNAKFKRPFAAIPGTLVFRV